MPEMTAKEYLRQALRIKRDIDRKYDQIAVLRAIGERATSSYSALRAGGTSRRSKVEDAVADIDDISDSILDDISRLTEKYREIAAVVNAVENPTYRQLLTLRYLGFKTWEEVAEKMNYSYVHVVHNLHPAALSKAKELIVFNTNNLI